MRILLIGDVVGKPGLEALLSLLPDLMHRYQSDFVIANAENVAAGKGINSDLARQILDAGVDVITLGNHTWQRPEIMPFLDREPRLLRPANYPPGAPGQGSGLFTASNGVSVGVANLLGRALMDPIDDPFRTGNAIIDGFKSHGAQITCFDFHAETTSEKLAFGLYVDGRATIVVGTHTHVQTADEQILEQGTAYITDMGMTGPQRGVIGMNAHSVIERFLTQRPVRFEVADGPVSLCGVCVTADVATGKAQAIERIQIRDIGGRY